MKPFDGFCNVLRESIVNFGNQISKQPKKWKYEKDVLGVLEDNNSRGLRINFCFDALVVQVLLMSSTNLVFVLWFVRGVVWILWIVELFVVIV